MAAKGLYGGEIDCLITRFLGDLTPYFGKAASAQLMTRTPGVRWLGVFARDELPDLANERRPFALVLNTDPHDAPGEHWLAIYAPTDGPLELFDSFGLPPSAYGLDSLAPRHSRRPFQSYSSSLCGKYCIYFLYMRIHMHSFDQIISWLSRMHSPDQWVHNYVGQLHQTYRVVNPCQRTDQCFKIKCSFC
jgi:hypothetical protein